MTFEEDFPSLKDDQFCDDGYESPCPLKVMQSFYPQTNQGDWLRLEDVQEHCLDKHKVKDIIENKLIEYQEEITSKYSSNEEKTLNNIKYQVCEDLLKELGLEDE